MNEITKKVLHLLEEKKGEDLLVLDVEGKNPFVDEIVLVTAPNARAMEAYAEEVVDLLEKEGHPVARPEGSSDSEWVLVDGKDFLLHILSKEKREELSLESIVEKSKEIAD